MFQNTLPHIIQKMKLTLIVVVIQEMNKITNFQKKNEHIGFTAILRTFIHIDKETLADMKHQSE